jgi:hypothetical protein
MGICDGLANSNEMLKERSKFEVGFGVGDFPFGMISHDHRVEGLTLDETHDIARMTISVLRKGVDWNNAGVFEKPGDPSLTFKPLLDVWLVRKTRLHFLKNYLSTKLDIENEMKLAESAGAVVSQVPIPDGFVNGAGVRNIRKNLGWFWKEALGGFVLSCFFGWI